MGSGEDVVELLAAATASRAVLAAAGVANLTMAPGPGEDLAAEAVADGLRERRPVILLRGGHNVATTSAGERGFSQCSQALIVPRPKAFGAVYISGTGVPRR